jgi:hypothetical protein
MKLGSKLDDLILSLGILRSVSFWCVSESVIGWCYRVTINMRRPSLLMCGLMKLRYSTLLCLFIFFFSKSSSSENKGSPSEKEYGNLDRFGKWRQQIWASVLFTKQQSAWLTPARYINISTEFSYGVQCWVFLCATTLKSLTLPKHYANRFLLVYAAYWHLMSNVCQWTVSPCDFPDWLDSMKTRLQWRPLQLSRWKS